MARRTSLLPFGLVVGCALVAAVWLLDQRPPQPSPPPPASPAAQTPMTPMTPRPPIAPVDPAQAAARQAWRAEQDGRMRDPLSPLGRIDYIHLPDGESRISPEKGAPLFIPAEALAPYVGDVRFAVQKSTDPTAYSVQMTAQPAVAVDGVLSSTAALKKGQLLAIGLLRLLLAGEANDPALALYDLGSPARRAYQGLHYYPDDDRYSVRAQLEPYAQPRTVRLTASRGDDKPMEAIGTLRFTLPDGSQQQLEAYLEQPGSSTLFLIFHDPTRGQPEGSYGAGRFLYATLQPGNTVQLDFNRAWNPLCAYSPYFHCPLPPRTNWLTSPIPVGEKVYAAH